MLILSKRREAKEFRRDPHLHQLLQNIIDEIQTEAVATFILYFGAFTLARPRSAVTGSQENISSSVGCHRISRQWFGRL
jgi:glycerol uptake facilitator-like aquaporin